MHALRQIIAVLSLALACAGPLPMWLHHVVAHSHSHAIAHSRTGASCGPQRSETPDQHACGIHSEQACKLGHAAKSPTACDVAAIAEAEHGCFVCFLLAQAADKSVWTSAAVIFSPLPEFVANGEPFRAQLLLSSNPARGPPTA